MRASAGCARGFPPNAIHQIASSSRAAPHPSLVVSLAARPSLVGLRVQARTRIKIRSNVRNSNRGRRGSGRQLLAAQAALAFGWCDFSCSQLQLLAAPAAFALGCLRLLSRKRELMVRAAPRRRACQQAQQGKARSYAALVDHSRRRTHRLRRQLLAAPAALAFSVTMRRPPLAAPATSGARRVGIQLLTAPATHSPSN